jgi:selenide,water dikinase
MVADAKTFGRIAAANALSDIYAMGGTPLYALNIVCFPQELDNRLLQEILAGGTEKCAEAGTLLAGGHSIYDDGIKYGLAVTGITETDKIYRNNTPRAGDKLILTKPLGVGVITSAYRDGEADAADVEEAIASMERLNKYAAEKLFPYNISACTDVTGFGLIVHLLEMTAGNVSAEICCDSLPYLSRVKHYIEDDYITGGGRRNREFTGKRADTDKLPLWVAELMFDPQTSGGLLIAVDSGQSNDLLHAIGADDPKAAIIGTIKERSNDEVMFV